MFHGDPIIITEDFMISSCVSVFVCEQSSSLHVSFSRLCSLVGAQIAVCPSAMLSSYIVLEGAVSHMGAFVPYVCSCIEAVRFL